MQSIVTVISALSALMHDVGKGTVSFQKKLKNKKRVFLDVLRHERLSVAVLRSLYDVTLNDGLHNGDDSTFFKMMGTMKSSEFKKYIKRAIKTDELCKHYCRNFEEARSASINSLESEFISNSYNTNVTVLISSFLLILSQIGRAHV